MTELNQSIQKTLNDKAKQSMLQECWSIVLSKPEQPYMSYMSYLMHYEDICSNCPTGGTGMLTHAEVLKAGRLTMNRTYNQCAEILQQYLSTSRSSFPIDGSHEEFVKSWMKLTTRALLLVDIEGWQGDQTLKDFLCEATFPVHKPRTTDLHTVKRSFNAGNLYRIGGLDIRWTDMVSEHLKLEEDGRQLVIFHHRAILDSLDNSKLYPERLFEEVRLTFDILFPRFDSECAKWYRKQEKKQAKRAKGSSMMLDPSLIDTKARADAERGFEHFTYFRDRLITLKERYDNHSPQTFKQYILDDRDPTRRWGFIIAVLVFFFGMAQTVEGAIQCYKAYHPTSA